MALKVYNAAGEEKRTDPAATMAPSGVAFRAFRSSQATFAVNATILFDAESYDPLSYYDPSTGRFNPKIPGYYRITAQAHFTGNTSGVHYGISINKNSVSQSIGRTWGTGGAGGIQVEVDDEVYLNGSTDYVTVVNTGQNSEVIHGSAASDWTTFTGSLVGSTVGVVPEPVRFVGDPGQVPFTNGWGTIANYDRPKFFKDPNGMVFLSGQWNSNGATNIQATILPVGYRPAEYHERGCRYWTGSANALGIVVITPQGEVRFYNNTNSTPPSGLIGYYSADVFWRAGN